MIQKIGVFWRYYQTKNFIDTPRTFYNVLEIYFKPINTSIAMVQE